VKKKVAVSHYPTAAPE